MDYKYQFIFLYPNYEDDLIICDLVYSYNIKAGIVYFYLENDKNLWLLKWGNRIDDYKSNFDPILINLVRRNVQTININQYFLAD